MKISNKFIKVLKSTYENIEFCVRDDGADNRTEFIKQNRGLRQGCNLSPILFSHYVNVSINHILFSIFHTYKHNKINSYNF